MINISINLCLYVVIGVIFGIFVTLFYLAQDYKQYECFIPEIVANTIAEGFIIGLSWIISIPILAILVVVLSIIKLICKGEE